MIQKNEPHDKPRSEHLIELGCRLAPEDQGGKGAEHESCPIQPAHSREAVQDSLQHARPGEQWLKGERG